MEYKIKHTYDVEKTYETDVDWNGHNFLIIYGHHINGWFICIPNWNISTEAGSPTDEFYNAERLSRVIDIPQAPETLAAAIREHYETCIAIPAQEQPYEEECMDGPPLRM